MIFNKEYDASLWYIVKADRKKGKEIVEFLKGIPDDAISAIRNEIELQKGNDVLEVPKIHRFMSKNESNIYYDFDVDPSDLCLTISKGIDDGKMGIDLFEIMLFPINLEELEELEYSDEEWLGIVTNITNTKYIADNAQETSEDEIEYNIHHFPIGYYVSHTKEILNGKRELVLYRPVSIKKVPKNLTTENILRRRLIPRK